MSSGCQAPLLFKAEYYSAVWMGCICLPIIHGWALRLVLPLAAVDVGVQMSPQDAAFTSCECAVKSGMAGSYNNSIFNFLRNHHTVFHRQLCHFTFPPTVREGFNFSPSHQRLFLFLFLF